MREQRYVSLRASGWLCQRAPSAAFLASSEPAEWRLQRTDHRALEHIVCLTLLPLFGPRSEPRGPKD